MAPKSRLEKKRIWSWDRMGPGMDTNITPINQNLGFRSLVSLHFRIFQVFASNSIGYSQVWLRSKHWFPLFFSLHQRNGAVSSAAGRMKSTQHSSEAELSRMNRILWWFLVISWECNNLTNKKENHPVIVVEHSCGKRLCRASMFTYQQHSCW